MATKKSQSKAQAKPAAMPQASAGMDSRTTWRWVYVLGGLVAALVGAIPSIQNPYLGWALMLLGVLVGWFYGDTEDVTNTGVRYLLLAAVYNALATVPAVGEIITGFVGGFLGFLGPMMLALLLRWFWNSVVSRMM